MKRSRLENILGTITFVSIFVPFITLKRNHSCEYDKCFRILYDGEMGMCVEAAIDVLVMAIGVFWWFEVHASMLVLKNKKNALSPFVIMIFTIAISVFIALMDPAKWYFAISLLVSFLLFSISVCLDKRNQDNLKTH